MRGFTFVELVVVLAVIAVLTHLAVREMSHFRDGKLVKAADRQLEDLKAAVYNRAADGESGGFLADMGRLPRLSDGALSELWAMPSAARPYAVRQAVAPNLCAGVPPAEGVYVPTGWRGPYLKLPLGRSRLLDPWGNAVESEDSAGLARLWTSNGFVVAAAHYGPSARASGERRISLVPEGGASSRLFVTTTSHASISAGNFEYRWYGPADGLVTGAVVSATCPGMVAVEGLAPGVKILWDSATGASRLVDVKPGDNMISVELP